MAEDDVVKLDEGYTWAKREIGMVTLTPPEQLRVYYFPNGDIVTLENVVEFLNSATTHRLKTSDGKLHIIPKTWIHIEITAEDWTV